MSKERVETIELPNRNFEVPINGKTISCGSGRPLMFISGPCVIDSKELIFETAEKLVEICRRNNVDLIFKSSYEKDNRGSASNWKGPLADEGLKILAEVRE